MNITNKMNPLVKNNIIQYLNRKSQLKSIYF